MKLTNGIELWEEANAVFEEMTHETLLTDPQAEEAFLLGTKVAKQVHNPAFRLLKSFGYTSFDYTKGIDD